MRREYQCGMPRHLGAVEEEEEEELHLILDQLTTADFCTLTPSHRLNLLQALCEQAMDNVEVRRFLDSSAEEVAKLELQGRKEAKMKRGEQQNKLVSATTATVAAASCSNTTIMENSELAEEQKQQAEREKERLEKEEEEAAARQFDREQQINLSREALRGGVLCGRDCQEHLYSLVGEGTSEVLLMVSQIGKKRGDKRRQQPVDPPVGFYNTSQSCAALVRYLEADKHCSPGLLESVSHTLLSIERREREHERDQEQEQEAEENAEEGRGLEGKEEREMGVSVECKEESKGGSDLGLMSLQDEEEGQQPKQIEDAQSLREGQVEARAEEGLDAEREEAEKVREARRGTCTCGVHMRGCADLILSLEKRLPWFVMTSPASARRRWREAVAAVCDATSAGALLMELQQTLKPQFSERTFDEGAWRDAVGTAVTFSQVAVCLWELDLQLKWADNSYKPCQICGEDADSERTLLCDGCDQGYHMFCLKPSLKVVPVGEWHCPSCLDPCKCHICGKRGAQLKELEVRFNKQLKRVLLCTKCALRRRSCSSCGKSGDLLHCSTRGCESSFHPSCLHPPPAAMTKDQKACWECPNCVAEAPSPADAKARKLNLQVGQQVEARWQQRHTWYGGVVLQVSEGGGGYDIAYHDGAVEQNVTANFIRPMANSRRRLDEEAFSGITKKSKGRAGSRSQGRSKARPRRQGRGRGRRRGSKEAVSEDEDEDEDEVDEDEDTVATGEEEGDEEGTNGQGQLKGPSSSQASAQGQKHGQGGRERKEEDVVVSDGWASDDLGSFETMPAATTKRIKRVKPPDEIFAVEAVVGKRSRKGVEEYLIKWQGYPSDQNSWEPASNIVDRRPIDQYQEEQ